MKTILLIAICLAAAEASLVFRTTCTTCLCSDSLDIPLTMGDAGGSTVTTGAFCNAIKRNGELCTIVTPPTTDNACIAIYGGTTLRSALSYATYQGIPIWGNETGSLAIMETHPHVTAGVLRLVLSMSSVDIKHQPASGDIGGISEIREILMGLVNSSATNTRTVTTTRDELVRVNKTVDITRNIVDNVVRQVDVTINRTINIEKNVDVVRNVVTNEIRNLTSYVSYQFAPGSETLGKAVSNGVSSMFINATIGVELIMKSLSDVLDVGGNLSLVIANIFERSVLTTAQQKTKYWGELVAVCLSAVLTIILILTNLMNIKPAIRFLRQVFESKPSGKAELFIAAATCEKIVPMCMIEEDFIGCTALNQALDFDIPDQCYFVGLITRMNHKIDSTTVASSLGIIRYAYATFNSTPYRSHQFFHLAINQWRNLDFTIKDGAATADGIHEATDDHTNNTAFKVIDSAIERALQGTTTRPNVRRAGTTFVRLNGNRFPMATSAVVWPFGFVVYDRCGMIVRAYKFETSHGEHLGTVAERDYFDSSYNSSRAAVKVARDAAAKKPDLKAEVKSIAALKKAGDAQAATTDGGLAFIL